MKRNAFAKSLVLSLGVTLLLGTIVPVWAQETPGMIQGYLMSMSVSEIENIRDNGINRTELDRLQTDVFQKNSLISDSKPITLSPGENEISISDEQLGGLLEQPTANVVVFLFEVTRQDENVDEEQFILYQCYAAEGDQESSKKINIREGQWRMPAGNKQFRFLYYRSAVQFQTSYYYFHLNFDSDSSEGQFILKLKLGT